MKFNKKNNFLILLCISIIITSSLLFFIQKTVIKPISTTPSANSCVVGGCSHQLCVDKNTESGVSTCEWREIYKCYKLATCEKQSTGKCGFTSNPEFKKCLDTNR